MSRKKKPLTGRQQLKMIEQATKRKLNQGKVRSRARWRDDADDFVDIPVRFWQTVSPEEFEEAVRRDYLDAEQCARLWRMTDRHSEPPWRLQIMINKADLMRWVKTIKPHGSKRRP